jgi:hypothetical protein
MRLLLRGDWPGVARRLLTFFVSPKKVSKERVEALLRRKPLPFGFPFAQGKKWEMK